MERNPLHRIARAVMLPSLVALAMSACGGDGGGDVPTAPAAPTSGPVFTMGAGLTATPAVRGNLGAFTFETEHEGFDFELKTRQSADIITLSATGGPGSHSGWHYHPGPAIVIVRRGTLTSYVAEDGGCRKTVYPTGTALIEGTKPHIVVNEGSTPIELSVVFLTPEGAAQRIDAPDPGC